ncbi:DNA polymerase III subunit epsilon [Parafrankia colletiae]|uniref:DNA polymerase III subunit epsilon n=1 Tax=Parafrankia colletiae TaxID=573497 RepID=A0A1S1R0Y3_9ACTN|nr:DEDDh family exonuclease [Parafrankia colletiae]MCK9898672.1 DEDDh family exonuclease [Frankia sp. Cpl3]OHV39459.1 DNA polymerase III subunit epsilon [Parafrankia colletiae]
MSAENADPLGSAARFTHPYAVVDVETTGLSPTRDRVLSIAVVLTSPDGIVEGRWSTLLDPGCDPGPVHIHGLTRQRLAGSPTFAAVVDELADLLAGRVLVAHNAAFDWRMLAGEALRIGRTLPVEWRLCTLTLASRLGLELTSLRLAALAAHWGIAQRRAHDAEDDAEVLAALLPRILERAGEQYLELPLTRCGVEREGIAVYPPRYSASGRPPPCQYHNPGPLAPGAPLVQGMRVVFTGPTTTERAALADRAAAAGLQVSANVSRRTSVLVTNVPDGATEKARAAARLEIPVRDERDFLALLEAVAPGDPVAELVTVSAGPPAKAEAAGPPEPVGRQE